MSLRLHRLAAIVRADVLIRLRRPSTAVVFVLLSIIPYMWIPAPSTGRALIQIGGRRALYNSAAIGMATALLGTIFIGLAGFYVVSNALKRDVISRCGYVIASTTMRGSEYIVGKFAGNVAFLTLFTLGYMGTAMAMVLLRGEAPLEPLVFAAQYLLLLPPAIVFVSAAAIVFECTPLLRSKAGDVAYFFLWIGSMGSVASMLEKGVGKSWAPWFDVSSVGFLFQQMQALYGTDSLSIGSISFDPKIAPLVFHGLKLTPEFVLPRIGATLMPMLLLVIARLFFHRFDPARVRAVAAQRATATWMGRFHAMARPIARLITAPANALAARIGGPAIVRATVADALLTISGMPLAVVVMLGFAIAATTSGEKSLFTGVMPFAFAACAIALADVACREKRAGTTALVFASPGLRAQFVAWKYLSTLLVAALLLAVPLARAAALRPSSFGALAVGVLFLAAASTALGVMSGNAKTFIVAFLTFWYIALSDKGATPSLDFAGWFGIVPPQVTLAYAGLALMLLAMAQTFHAYELRRNW